MGLLDIVRGLGGHKETRAEKAERLKGEIREYNEDIRVQNMEKRASRLREKAHPSLFSQMEGLGKGIGRSVGKGRSVGFSMSGFDFKPPTYNIKKPRY